MTGMIEGRPPPPPPPDRRILLGSKFSISGFFGVRKFWQVFFMVFKTNVSIFLLYHYILILSGNFYGSEIQHWIFGGYILVQGFFGVLFEAQGIVLGF